MFPFTVYFFIGSYFYTSSYNVVQNTHSYYSTEFFARKSLPSLPASFLFFYLLSRLIFKTFSHFALLDVQVYSDRVVYSGWLKGNATTR